MDGWGKGAKRQRGMGMDWWMDGETPLEDRWPTHGGRWRSVAPSFGR